MHVCLYIPVAQAREALTRLKMFSAHKLREMAETMAETVGETMAETVEGRPVRSFATRSAARGFTEVRSELTVEQKLDILIRDRDEKMNKQREADLQARLKSGRSAIGAVFVPSVEDGLTQPALSPAPGSRGSGGVDVRALAASVDALSARQEAAFGQMRDAHASLATQMQALQQAVAELGRR